MTDPSDDSRLKQLDDRFRQAMAHRKKGESELAENLLCEILQEYRAEGYPDREVMVTINLAQILHQQGRLDEAVEEYQRALEQAERLDDTRRKALILGALSVIDANRGDREGSRHLLEESLRLYREVGDPVGIANQLGNLGLLRQSEGRVSEALECFSQAAALFAAVGNAPGAIGVLQCVGELQRRQGEYAAAMVSHQNALLLAQQVGDLPRQAQSLRAIGQLERVKGNLDTAARFIEKGMSLHQRTGDGSGVLAGLIDLGTVEFARGRPAEAIGRLDRCIAEAGRLRLFTPLVKALLNRALYRLDTDRMDLVQADLDEVKRLLDSQDDPSLWSLWSLTTVRILLRESRWEEAGRLLQEELERVTTANLVGVRPAILGLIASLDTVLGKTRQGIEGFHQAEALYRALGDAEGTRMAVLAYAQNVAETGAIQESLAALDGLWKRYQQQKSSQPVVQGEILLGRATVHHLRGAYREALADLALAIESYREADSQVSWVGSQVFEAKVMLDAHRVAGAPLPEELGERLDQLVAQADTFRSPTISTIAHLTQAEAWLAFDRAEQGRSGTPAAADRTELVRKEALQALQQSEEIGFPVGVCRSLELFAWLDDDREKAKRARDLWLSMECTVRAAQLTEEWGLAAPSEMEKP
ncbi:MAG: tetratricopeptide repeat protein [Bradymonadales bacterium]|nr:tetratricopeptide repeat protein [Bradymonadales bacterium]